MQILKPKSREKSERLLALLSEAKKRNLPIDEVVHTARTAPTEKPKELRPFPDSPQERAYLCDADIIGYGGAGGGGKSFLALIKAATQHHRSVIFRRVSPSLDGIIKDSIDHFPERPDWRFVQSPRPKWRFDNRRTLTFDSMQYEQGKENYRSNPHDFMVFEEATEFTRSQVTFVTAWNRSTVINPKTHKPYKCQMLLTFNPPQTDDGMWVMDFFGPWLNPTHHNPAKDGELRYYTTIDGEEVECATDDPIEIEFNGKVRKIKPKSRTFFHASIDDNPIFVESHYDATLAGLPEPMRSLMMGDFARAHLDDLHQVIPSAWVDAAMVRWANNPKPTTALSAIGVDVARGGKDATVIAPRYGTWFDTVELHPGISTTDGTIVADYVMPYALRNASVVLDIIGVGTSPYDVCVQRGYTIYGFNGGSGAPPPGTDKTGRIQMLNMRAWAYWSLREALDPRNGDDICLPPDPELKADLCSGRWQMTPLKLKIESKDEIKKRIGRSPDKGDALIMAAFIAPEASIAIGGSEPTPQPVNTTNAFLKRLQHGTHI